MISSEKWEKLSSRARAWLGRENAPGTVGHPIEEVRAHLDRAGCPRVPCFVDHLVRYAGLEFDYRSGPQSGRVRFDRIEDGARLMRSDLDHRWRLVLGSPVDDHVSWIMGDDGSISSAFGRQSSLTYAGRIEVFLEDLAIQQDAAARGCILDWAVTTLSDGAAGLASEHPFSPLPEASDRFTRWWAGQGAGVGIRPAGAISSPRNKRFHVVAFWPLSRDDLGTSLAAGLTSLLEPYSAAWRSYDGFEEYRRTGDHRLLDESIEQAGPVPRAPSFRLAARQGLAMLHREGRISEPPPGSDDAFLAYLRRSIEVFRRSAGRDALYYASVGLAAFGHAPALLGVLENLPRGADPGWGRPLWAGQYLSDLVPFLSPCTVDETKAAMDWVRRKLDSLILDETTGRYSCDMMRLGPRT